MGAMSSMSSSLRTQTSVNIYSNLPFTPLHTFDSNAVGKEDIFSCRPTAHQVLAVCQNVQHSRRHDMLNRPVMPHRLLNDKQNKTKIVLNLHDLIKYLNYSCNCVYPHLPGQFHACEPDTRRYLPLWPSLESSGQIDQYTPRSL